MIVIFSEKGGVGKSNLSFTIAKDLDKHYYTNDSSIISSVYERSTYTDKKMAIDKDGVYDLGGFLTRYVTDVLDKASIVIIPTIADYNAMLKAIKVIDYVGVERAIVIANMIDKPQDLEEIQDVIMGKHPTVRVLPLKRSRIFKNGLESGQSARDINNASALNKHIYKAVIKQYENILMEISKWRNNLH